MAHDVFVSYHSDSSRTIADQVVRKMEQNGIVCWYAPRDVQEKFALDIMDAIQGCKIFVVLLNKASSESEFVLDEIAEAKESKRKIIVLQLTDEVFSKEAKLYLKRYHWVKADNNLSAAIDELVDRALLNLGRQKTVVEAPVEQKEERLILSYCGKKFLVKPQTITFDGGHVYIGEVFNGKPHGKGKLCWSDGATHEGEYVNGLRNGLGSYRAANGDVYEGEFLNDVFCGKGKYTWSDGQLYEGEWKNGRPNGRGKRTWPNGNVYEGEEKDGLKCGKGKIIWANGDVYEGEWADDKQNGYGVLTPAKGKVQRGRFKDGKYIGK